jgi:hypothetical protein
MSLPHFSKQDVLEALAKAPNSRFERCRALLVADARQEFPVAQAPAALLRESLEMKYRIAKSRGLILDGDTDLLVALTDLGSEPVTGVVVDVGDAHVFLYLRAETLEPVGCVTVQDGGPLPDDAERPR